MFQVLSFILYWLKQEDEHSLHSPFLFDFYTKVVRHKGSENEQIELLRKKLLTDKTEVALHDFGAGSRVSGSVNRSISSIAKYSSTPAKFSLLLQRIIAYFDFKEVIELGTSLGLNTLYLSQNPKVKVSTFEGDERLSQLAKTHFHSFRRNNIDLVTGNIDQTLEKVLNQVLSVDLAYMDANHRYSPTLDYFELLSGKTHDHSIVIIDDIHWSKGMWKAWNELKSRPEVTLSLDLFEAGLLFFNPKFDGASYTLKF